MGAIIFKNKLEAYCRTAEVPFILPLLSLHFMYSFLNTFLIFFY